MGTFPSNVCSGTARGKQGNRRSGTFEHPRTLSCCMAGVPPGLANALKDHYVLERELGRGGMATVYLAHDLRHDRPVALKVLHPELAAVLGAERFLREIKLAARLQHPHILSVHDSGDAGNLDQVRKQSGLPHAPRARFY